MYVCAICHDLYSGWLTKRHAPCSYSQTIIAHKLRKFNAVSYVHIVSQNIRHLIFYNLKKPGPIFVIFSVQYPELL